MRNDPLPFNTRRRPPVTCDDLVNFYAREQKLARRRPRFLAHFLFWIAFLVALFFALRFVFATF